MKKVNINKKILSIFEDYRIYLDEANKDIDINFDTYVDIFGFDSLDMVEIVINLENAFDIQMEDIYVEETFSKMKTIGDIRNELKKSFGIFDICEERRDKINNIENSDSILDNL